MNDSPFVLFFHSDHRIFLDKPNSGAEMATLCEAKYLAKRGLKVVVVGHLVGKPLENDPVEYWDIGEDYRVEEVFDRADKRGVYYLIGAGKGIPFFFARQRPQCLSRMLVSHDRSAFDTGVRPSVLRHLVDKVICVSHAQRQKLIQDGGYPDLYTVIHNGVDLEFFPPSEPSAHVPTRLLFSGALVPDKGLHVLLASYAKIKALFPELTLDIYGSASLWSREAYLDENTIQAQLPGVRFHGSVSQEKLREALREAGICVVPSIWFEPFPLTSLEAQVSGCPVVGFDVGGIGEGIEDGVTGVVVREVSEEALTHALLSLLRDHKKMAELSRNCLQKARAYYRWERVAEEFERLSAHFAKSRLEQLQALTQSLYKNGLSELANSFLSRAG